MGDATIDPTRLDVLRALADPTRNALYRQLRSAAGPLTTPELADRVALHPNTVRAHLDQLCAVGLVRADTAGHGGRGRPRHRFTAVDPPPSPAAVVDDGTGPAATGDPAPATEVTEPAAARLARALVEVAEDAGVRAEVIRSVGWRTGRDRIGGARPPSAVAAAELVVQHEAAAGYGPVLDEEVPGRWRLTFTTCPYRDLAHDAPEVVCSLHAGAVEGACTATGRLQLEAFAAPWGGRPCHAVLCEVAGD